MKPNKLIHEKSPYLLQHSLNPVNWYPWCEEAFNLAINENKPIFLSIGYSTCHWCHVMEKESFEDQEVAQILNDNFISIKVDREEHPEIDHIYMNICILLTGSGGWPLTIFMTPDKKPFFAGTYFPKHNKFGRPGLIELLNKIIEIWNNDRESILKSSEEIINQLKNYFNSKSRKDVLDSDIINRAYNELCENYDDVNGGFGTAPKFPIPHNLSFLLKYSSLNDNEEGRKMVSYTLKKMRSGGIYDQIGYGFHRYSTDEKWIVPHFEKMLYDQALMTKVYTEMYQVTGETFFKKTAQEILEYVMRDMTSPEGGFYSAEDADSEGKEGKFYLWKFDEIKNILADKSKLFSDIYNVFEEGNFNIENTNTKSGENILYIKNTIEELAIQKRLSMEELEKELDTCRKAIFEYREKRVRPHKDDKILTNWNALMISSFANAAFVFDNSDYLNTAKSAMNFLIKKLLQSDGFLLHRYRDGESAIQANLDDYAFTIQALLELYQCSADLQYLKLAIQLQDYQIEHFWDKINGGFYFTTEKSEGELILRTKDAYDGEIPSGNSVSLYNLIKIFYITANNKYNEYAKQLTEAFAFEIKQKPSAYTSMLVAYIELIQKHYDIVIVGELEDSHTKMIIDIIRKKYLPDKTILYKIKNTELEKLAPYTVEMTQLEGKPTIYICENFNCLLPTNRIEEIEKYFELIH